MTFNEFNSKINLPEVCRIMGVTGLSFIKLPRFGWYAYNQNRSQIINLFQLFSENDIAKLYRKFTLETTEVQEFTMVFGLRDETTLFTNYTNLRMWNTMFKDAVYEASRALVSFGDTVRPLLAAFKEGGYPHLCDIPIGYVNANLIKKYKKIEWPEHAQGRLIVPTYCTPLHICSYELYTPKAFKHLKTLFVNDEVGWMGKLGNTVVQDVAGIGSEGGFTWNHKCDFWLDQPISVSKAVEPSTCINIWSEAKSTRFITSPLDIIIANKKEDDVKGLLSKLNCKQVGELEHALNLKLMHHWVRIQQREITIGNYRYVDTGGQYYIENLRNRSITEFTNFTVHVEKLIKNGNQYFRKGIIRTPIKEEAFIFDEASFNSPNTLYHAVRAFFLSHGLGIPIILSTHKRYLIDVVNRMNRLAPIEVMEPALEDNKGTLP